MVFDKEMNIFGLVIVNKLDVGTIRFQFHIPLRTELIDGNSEGEREYFRIINDNISYRLVNCSVNILEIFGFKWVPEQALLECRG